MKSCLLLACILLLQAAGSAAPTILLPAERLVVHPRIAADPANSKAAIQERLLHDPAAKAALDRLKAEVAVYVQRHQSDPTWMVSRLQMYWKSHATEIFINGPFYDHAGGPAAPVPTVRFSGARDGTTNYGAPPLEDVPPYAEDERGVYLINRQTGRGEWVDPAKTGRAIESINTRIMGLAQSAAMVAWVTDDENYARFARDLFDAYMSGMAYRRKPVDLTHGHHQTIVGFSTFEVIQEGILGTLATTYDYLHGYLTQHDRERIPAYTATFKRWIDNTIENGVPFNNWDLIEARHVLGVARVLDRDSDYPDGRGSHYYVDQIVNHTSLRQWSLVELLQRGFDPTAAIWNESPGYAQGVVGDFAGLLTYFDDNFSVDLLPDTPMIGRAVLASAEYLFPNGYTAAWGDSHYGRLSLRPARALVRNAQRHGRRDQEVLFTRFIKTLGTADATARESGERPESGLFDSSPLRLDGSIPAGRIEEWVSPLYYSAQTSWLVQRNGMDPESGLMISQNGSAGNHMHANGIAMELYGKGLVLGPASGIGTSYFQPDYAEYYSQFPAHNTVVVDGISSYPAMRSNHGFTLNASYPASGIKAGYFATATFSDVSFREPETNADQRRVMGIVRTGEKTGYYVDIFRSRRNDGHDRKHEYFYHNLGQELTLASVDGQPLGLQPTDQLAFAAGDLFAYDYFWDKESARTSGDFRANFRLTQPGRGDVTMALWMKGEAEREIFAVKAPRSRAVDGMLPGELGKLPLPTLVVRQSGEAWTRPFAAIFEPTSTSAPSSLAAIAGFRPEGAPSDFVGLRIDGRAGDRQYIFSATESNSEIRQENMTFVGTYAVISTRADRLEYLFLGRGRRLSCGDFALVVPHETASAALTRVGPDWDFTASEPVQLRMPASALGGKTTLMLTVNGRAIQIRGQAPAGPASSVVEFALPAMPLTRLRWE